MTTIWERKKRDCGAGWWLAITLRCNFSCDYCSVDTHRSTFEEQQPEPWIDLINNVLKGPITITGGEPFLYEPLMEVLHGSCRKLRVNTNAKLITPEILRLLDSRGHETVLLVSFHRHSWSLAQINDWMRMVQSAHTKHIRYRTISLRPGPPDAFDGAYRRLAAKLSFPAKAAPIAQKKFKWPPPSNAERVLCHRQCFIMYAPDGNRYPCARHMHAKQFPLDPSYGVKGTVVCENYGECAMCDRHGPIKIEPYHGDLPSGVYPHGSVE